MKLFHSVAVLFVSSLALASCAGGGRDQAPGVTAQPTGWSVGGVPEPDPRSPKVVRAPLTDAELAALPRDERRTRIIEGFVCNRQIQGQAGYVRYLPGGRVLVGHHEGDVQLRWKVENDQFCIENGPFNRRCFDLPKEDLPNERETFLSAFSKSCV